MAIRDRPETCRDELFLEPRPLPAFAYFVHASPLSCRVLQQNSIARSRKQPLHGLRSRLVVIL